MAEPITVDNGALTDYAVLVDDVVDATLGTGAKQLVGLADATIGSTTKVAAGGGVEANALRVTVASDSTGVLSVDDNGATLSVDDGAGSLTVDGSVSLAAAIPAGTNNIGDVDVVTVPAPLSTAGGGLEATALRVTLASDSTGLVSVDDNGGSLTVDGTVTANLAAGTNNIGDVDVLSLPALPAGTNNIGDVDVLSIAAGDNNIGNVDIASAIPAGTNLIGAVNVKPATSGGLTIFRSIDLDETEEEVKATAGQLFGWYIFNAAATTHYVKLYNATAANVTVGTTTPVMTVPVPAGSAANVEFVNGIAFGTAITAAATTGVADADTGAPAANAVVVNLLYA